MTYYFPPNFKGSLPFFVPTELTATTKDDVAVVVESWLADNDFALDAHYDYVKRTTLNLIDPVFDHGQFYYIHLNSYMRDVANVVFNQKFLPNTDGPAKEAAKKFTDFMKSLYPTKPKKVSKNG